MAKQTVKFISKYAPDHIYGVRQLKEELGIDFMFDMDLALVSLTYNQIDSPKTHPIVQECRGLILDIHNLDVVCRPFDRFFNYGEAGTQVYKDQHFDYFPKVDGSLIKVFHHKGRWHIGTKSTIAVVGTIGSEDKGFDELVYEAVGVQNSNEFTKLCKQHSFNPNYTYMFELKSPHNRVITHYNQTSLNWLAVRKNTGEYVDYNAAKISWWGFPAEFLDPLPFRTIPEAEAYCLKLRGLEEGLVGYQYGVPLIKVKSPLYVAAHHMRTAPTLKRYLEIIFLNEVDEYLAYYPDDKETFDKAQEIIDEAKSLMDEIYRQNKDITDQKEFALRVKSNAFSQFIFNARRNGTWPSNEFDAIDLDRKVKFFLDKNSPLSLESENPTPN